MRIVAAGSQGVPRGALADSASGALEGVKATVCVVSHNTAARHVFITVVHTPQGRLAWESNVVIAGDTRGGLQGSTQDAALGHV